jgi:hypothetical protein
VTSRISGVGFFQLVMNTEKPWSSRYHQALLRVEVEDVELVDPRRDDDDGHGMHLLRRRRVVDDFQQAVAEHHRAGVVARFLPTVKSSGRVMRTLPASGPRGRDAHAAHQALAVGLGGLAIATGLVSRKLVGAMALSHLRHQKAARRRSLPDSAGVS